MHVKKLIHQHIKKNGPISFSKFIQMAMYHNELGYYVRQNPIGKNKDYITSPHITSLFGQIIAIWIAHQYNKLGDLNHGIAIAELGPGSGIMMLDIITTLKKLFGQKKDIEIHMIEISPALKKCQAQNLKNYIEMIEWHNEISTLPSKTIFFISNEFFDALPVDQFIFLKNSWFENKITENFTIEKFETDLIQTKYTFDGMILERCKLGKKIAEAITNHIEKFSGAALMIDYGYCKNRFKSTIQAVKNHKYCDLMSCIGDADITHEVDFAYLFHNWQVVLQKDFLINHGIMQRALAGARFLQKDNQDKLENAVKRLIMPQHMGHLFKCAMI